MEGIVDNLDLIPSLDRHEHPILAVAWSLTATPVQTRRETLFLALLGAMVATLMGVFASIATRRPILVVLTVLAGPCVGFSSGAAAAIAATRVGRASELIEAAVTRADPVPRAELQRAILIQGLNWSLIAAGAGLTVSIALHERVGFRPPVKGALSGGMIAGVLYPVLGACLFPMESTLLLIPLGPGIRSIWILVPVLVVALGICRSVARREAMASAGSPD